jgi:nickel/cobalt transporter (NiCoT) family protein
MAGLGALAYGLGLRHAFDADHLAAIDDTTRYLLRRGEEPLAAGFFFSIGHSTVVLAMALALVLATNTMRTALPQLQSYGSVASATVTGVFLWLLGILNLLVLVDILRIWRLARRGAYQAEKLEEVLARRGLMRRMMGGRLQQLIAHSWQMYPVGMIFALGFDTASEIGLLGLTAGVALEAAPALAVVSLALLFASGMSLMDTADGVFMVKAYGWAFSNPLRKIYYNITTTGLAVAIALLIGSIELLQVLAIELNLHGRFFDGITALNFESLGYGIFAMFVAVWACAVLVWRFRRLDEGWKIADERASIAD